MPVASQAPADKKLARQQSAEDRKKLAPLKKQMKALDAKIAKGQKQLQAIEEQLADGTIYEESQADVLKNCLAEQVNVKNALTNLEEEWLETQELIESMN